MAATPLFDCVTHPTCDGTWPGSAAKEVNSFASLQEEMGANDVSWALAHGLGFGGYDLEDFAQDAREAGEGILPVAYFDPRQVQERDEVSPWLQLIRDLGYVGLKVHPRLSALTYDDPRLPTLIAGANHAGLVPLICTYCWERSERCAENSVEALARLLAKVPNEKVVLVHGGGVRLLEHVELARAHRNVLLDLSLTLTKYEGSSIDLDLRFCFERFDQRICVGSDSPENTLADLRRRFEQFAADLPETKRKNIAHANLLTYLGM